jgi:hypothetical protein
MPTRKPLHQLTLTVSSAKASVAVVALHLKKEEFIKGQVDHELHLPEGQCCEPD